MRRTLVLLAAITATTAHAARGPATAVLAAPARGDMVITDSGVWRWNGTDCAGAASQVLREAVVACTAVAGRARCVAAFTAGAYAFTDADPVRCNRRIRS